MYSRKREKRGWVKTSARQESAIWAHVMNTQKSQPVQEMDWGRTGESMRRRANCDCLYKDTSDVYATTKPFCLFTHANPYRQSASLTVT